jgi:Transposase DDE domain group 1
MMHKLTLPWTRIRGQGQRELYEGLYRVRGEMENRIKEQQHYLFADRTSAATMGASQMRLYLSSIAYGTCQRF